MPGARDQSQLVEQCRRALRTSEARFQNVVDKNAEGIVVLQHDGVICYANPAAALLLGKPVAKLVGSAFELPAVPGTKVDTNITRPDKQTRVAETRVVETEWDGKPAYLVSLRDITGQRQVEASLRQRARELAEDDRRKDELLAILSHELRNPLAAILNASAVMGSCPAADPGLSRARDAIERQVKHMARLLDDLLDVSRITHGKVELRKEPLELSMLVGEVVQQSRSLISERRHRLIIALPPEPLWVEADPTRLAQVVANLLSNAAKYTAPGGRIWLSADRENDEAVIRVRDSGIGIPPDMLQRIFDLFTQLDRSYERQPDGLGIGLTLVRRLVEQHGGRVSAKSNGEGQGSEFVVTLPTHEPKTPALGVPALPTPSMLKAAASLRIALVEDMPDAREMLRELLEMMGHEVETASDGPGGLELILDTRPDLALVDVGLPRLDGLELARQVRARQQGTPEPGLLVALTGYSQPRDRQRALEAGFDDHLVKPVQLDDLLRVIESVSARRREARADTMKHGPAR